MLMNFLLFLCMERHRVWAHWNHSFHMYLRYLGPVSCSFPPWVPSGHTVEGSWSAWWLDGCSIFCLLIRQATFSSTQLRTSLSQFSSVQFSSVAQSCPTLCNPMNSSTPGLPVHHQLPEFTQTHIHWVSDAIQSSHPLSSPSPPAPNPSQHQGRFQWVNSSQEVAKILEFQL